MGYSPCRRSFAAVMAAAISVSAATAAIAQQIPASASAETHDGVYSVGIYTQQGGCDKVYHWTITVQGGHISSPADGFMKASGEITVHGIVSVAFRRDSHVANVSGQVKEKSGWGTWSSSTLKCAGTWDAVRQDGPSRAPTMAALSR
jgi:hypothetical protein